MNMRYLQILSLGLLLVLNPTTSKADEFEHTGDQIRSDVAVQLEAALGWNRLSVDDEDGNASADGIAANGVGSVAFDVERFHVQLDALIRSDDFSEGNFITWGFGSHIGLRDENRGQVGINSAYTQTQLSSGQGNLKWYRIGGEAEYFMDRLTFGGSAGYIAATSNDGDGDSGSAHFYYFKALARFYVSDDFKIESSFGYLDPDEGDSVKYLTVEGEYRPNHSSYSLFARWNSFYSDDEDVEIETDQVLAGIKINFGAGRNESIKTNDRRHFADSCVLEATTFFNIC